MTGETSRRSIGRGQAEETAPIPPDEMRCPCGSTVLRPHRGFWRRLWWYFLLPLLTLGIYALLAAVGAAAAQSYAAIGIAIALLPVLSAVIVWLVLRVFGHRGWCLTKRTVAWWFWWPGTLLILIASF